MPLTQRAYRGKINVSEEKKEAAGETPLYAGGLIAFKWGMTSLASEKGHIAVTLLYAPRNTVTEIRTKEKNKYSAVQLGVLKNKPQRYTKAIKGFFAKKKIEPLTHLKEFRMADTTGVKVGSLVGVEGFQIGERVAVTGISKGKGFQGVMRRHNFHGGPASRGSRFHRTTGSIGMRARPGRVYKRRKMPGHMGDEQVSLRNLEVVDVDSERELLIIKGAVPGATRSLVSVRKL